MNAGRRTRPARSLQDGLAIKLLKEEWLADEEIRHRFRREARLGRDLKHQGILPILYSNLSAERPYLVSPLASGSLADELKANRAADRDWSLDLFGALLEAMAHAHERDVLHRDLKPDNVLLIGERPLISDFGMGKELAVLPSGPTLTNQPVGTSSTWLLSVGGLANRELPRGRLLTRQDTLGATCQPAAKALDARAGVHR